MNETILRATGFSREVELVHNSQCPLCSREIEVGSFRDELSIKEYKISGMCQKCQDKIFGV